MTIPIGSIWSHYLGKSMQKVIVIAVTDKAVYVQYGMTKHCIDKETFLDAYLLDTHKE